LAGALKGATPGATFGATYLGKFGSDNQAVKCQVCRVSPPVDVEESYFISLHAELRAL